MPGKTAKVTITERQQDILRTIADAPTASSQLRQRATIILLAFEKQGNREIAAEVGLSRPQVSLWRRRWADAWDRLIRDRVHSRPRPPCAAPSSEPSAMSPGPAPRQVHPRADRPDPGRRLRAPGEVRPAHHPLDGPRAGR